MDVNAASVNWEQGTACTHAVEVVAVAVGCQCGRECSQLRRNSTLAHVLHLCRHDPLVSALTKKIKPGGTTRTSWYALSGFPLTAAARARAVYVISSGDTPLAFMCSKICSKASQRPASQQAPPSTAPLTSSACCGRTRLRGPSGWLPPVHRCSNTLYEWCGTVISWCRGVSREAASVSKS